LQVQSFGCRIGGDLQLNLPVINEFADGIVVSAIAAFAFVEVGVAVAAINGQELTGECASEMTRDPCDSVEIPAKENAAFL
jgi:hypothetical protein